MRYPALVLGLALALARGATAQAPSPIRAEDLRADLFAIAHDSMGGRATGERGDHLVTEWLAAAFRRAGLEPAGEGGTFFQTVPFAQVRPDRAATLRAGVTDLAIGADLVPIGVPGHWALDGVRAVFGGSVGDSTAWPAAGAAAERLVVFAGGNLEPRAAYAAMGRAQRHPRFAGAAGFAVAVLDRVPGTQVAQLLEGRLTTDTTRPTGRPALLVTARAADALLGVEAGSAPPGHTGPVLSGAITFRRDPPRYPARNVVAVLPGRDPARRNTYVAVTAHHDHVGTGAAVDHDSTRAYNRVVRPLGADSRDRPPTAEERARIQALRDSLRRDHLPRADSIFNGADDDGSGTVALVAVARALAAGPRPARSVLFVAHAAEERGLVGSRWFTDHPTVPRDSIVAEMDMDMVGRGTAAELPAGGEAYLEVVGSRRLSREFGDLLEAVNARLTRPFRFNYEYDAPGHPQQYYCRADHFSYARYGIPAVSLSRGEHLDYHQVTDEPQYISYQDLANVATLVLETARAVAELDHRPVVDGPRQDPRAACRQ